MDARGFEEGIGGSAFGYWVLFSIIISLVDVRCRIDRWVLSRHLGVLF
jgi:hypothetical protein